jgi:hypothetical protein
MNADRGSSWTACRARGSDSPPRVDDYLQGRSDADGCDVLPSHTLDVLGVPTKPSVPLHAIVPIVFPASWRGADGASCARRLIGSRARADEDPWIVVAQRTATGYEVLRQDALPRLADVLGHPVTSEHAERLAVAVLVESGKRDDAAFEWMGSGQPPILGMTYEDLAASMVLDGPLLGHLQQQLGSSEIFFAIPTRATLYVTGEASGALRLAHSRPGSRPSCRKTRDCRRACSSRAADRSKAS